MQVASSALSRLLVACTLLFPPAAWAQQLPVPPPRPPVRPTIPSHVPIVTPPRQPKAQRPTLTKPAPTRPAPPAPAPPPPEPPPEPSKGSVTGLPLPRFAALRSDDVNLRTGPGTRYPTDWVYKRRDLPVQIEREFDVWRLIRDPDGIRGWVHQSNLTGRRSFVVTEADRTLRRQATEDALPVARLQPGVIGHIRICQANVAWCQVQVGDYRGWLKRTEFWGSLPDEAIN